MPIYAVLCECGWRGEVFAPRPCGPGKVECGGCGRVGGCRADWERQNVRLEHTLIGNEGLSLAEGFDPTEVGEARQLFGGVSGVDISDDGDVRFSGLRAQREYLKRKRGLGGDEPPAYTIDDARRDKARREKWKAKQKAR